MKKTLSLVICLLLLAISSCGKKNDDKTIRVGASSSPHAEILKECKSYVESKGYKLEIVEFSDYILPNVGVAENSLDANYFQHQPYMENYNKKNKTSLKAVLKVHFEPLGFYAGKKSKLEDIEVGSTIGIPNDDTNCARALYLLRDLGLISVDESKGFEITSKDITSNPKKLQIVELEAAQLPTQLPSFDYAVINGNYALESHITSKLLSSEDSNGIGATTYANILCVNEGNENSEKTKILIEALSQSSIKDFINNKYQGVVVPLI